MTDNYKKYYQETLSGTWIGRDSERQLYWHEHVTLSSLDAPDIAVGSNTIGILGYACDEGVRRNHGRVGASAGPGAIRERLGKLSYHALDKSILDFGDVVCHHRALEQCQKALSQSVSWLLSGGVFPIVLGGGHDVAYGHFIGILDHLQSIDNKKIGIVNFDAHFDLRPVVGSCNSGTPFYQILSGHGATVSYMPIGIQRQANNQELFDIAERYDVPYVMIEDCSIDQLSSVTDRLLAFIEEQDYIYLTVDMDGFSSAYAPGVSAPSPVGLEPSFVLKLLDVIMGSKKLISCDLAELNPVFDRDKSTARLAAIIVDYIVRGA